MGLGVEALGVEALVGVEALSFLGVEALSFLGVEALSFLGVEAGEARLVWAR